jgi:hypothetical protein
MYTDFNNLSGTSRIWIYQSDRILTDDESEEINGVAKSFVEQWTAHQQTLMAGFKIFHHLFLILAVDENHNDASGCSIDKSVHFIKAVEKKFNLNLFNRLNVVYDDGSTKNIIHFNKLKTLLAENKITGSIKVFNNTITTKNDLSENWLVSVKESWVGTKVGL